MQEPIINQKGSSNTRKSSVELKKTQIPPLPPNQRIPKYLLPPANGFKKTKSTSRDKSASSKDFDTINNFLKDVDDVIKEEKKSTKNIKMKLDKQDDLQQNQIIEKIMFSSNEKQQIVKAFNQERSQMYTSNPSGQEYMLKVIKKIDNL